MDLQYGLISDELYNEFFRKKFIFEFQFKNAKENEKPPKSFATFN
jgi:hypothetical protein